MDHVPCILSEFKWSKTQKKNFGQESESIYLGGGGVV